MLEGAKYILTFLKAYFKTSLTYPGLGTHKEDLFYQARSIIIYFYKKKITILRFSP